MPDVLLLGSKFRTEGLAPHSDHGSRLMQWDEFELPSNRKFGIFLALVCGALAIYLAFRSRTAGAWAAGIAALAVGLIAWLESPKPCACSTRPGIGSVLRLRR
jgi:hypothetical protein